LNVKKIANDMPHRLATTEMVAHHNLLLSSIMMPNKLCDNLTIVS